MVMTKSVAAKPSRHRTNALPRQRGSSSSSIEMLPCPLRAVLGDAPVDRQRAETASEDQDEGGDRREEPTASEHAIPGSRTRGGEVVHARQAHDLPPRRSDGRAGRVRPRVRAAPRRTTGSSRTQERRDGACHDVHSPPAWPRGNESGRLATAGMKTIRSHPRRPSARGRDDPLTARRRLSFTQETRAARTSDECCDEIGSVGL